MNIVVCLKRVPDSSARIKFTPDGKSLDSQGVEFVISPYDEIAIEAALRFKEQFGGETVGVTVDPDGNEAVLRKALAMGLDRGILVKAATGFDGAGTARVLSEVLKGLSFDLLLFGKQAIDDDAAQVPTLVAHRLNLPRVNVCVGIEFSGTPPTSAKCRRQVEGGEEILDLALPFAASIQKGVNGIHEPRYPSLKGIMAAKKKTIEVKEVPGAAPLLEVIRMELPPERPPGRIVGQGASAVPELVRLLREEAKVI